jgi:glycosyltransferase involved in cell wall biosynthesis
LFHFLSKYTTRRADITIVTNEFLRKFVDSWGGRGFVLQDKLPSLNEGNVEKLHGVRNVALISTFSDDEPILEVVTAAKLIPSDWFIYVTGKYDEHKLTRHNLERLPDNVILTGYLPEPEFQTLLKSVDAIVVLTTAEHTLTCGAYEGLSLLKPMILSDTPTIREYFSKGAIYTNPTRKDIAAAIGEVIASKDRLRTGLIQLKKDLAEDWDSRFAGLIGAVQSL